MEQIPKNQVLRRLSVENPWWDSPHEVPNVYQNWSPRAYLELLFPLVKARAPHRAVVLMGPRRVGKTVLLHHVIQRLLEDGVNPSSIASVSVDHPLYNGLSLEELLDLCTEASGFDFRNSEAFIFFDEIQYLKNWETHLKRLVDDFPNLKTSASGSAAAALRLKSNESGAGRLTDFILPPLTFYEYLALLDASGAETPEIIEGDTDYYAADLQALNNSFVHYLNFGGYPEVVLSAEIQRDPSRFIKSDIIDKVLLRDLPSLYGIQDIQELNSLFTTLAFNTAQEVSLTDLSKRSNVAKNTLKRYIEYLEAAFLVRRVHRIDRDGRRFRRVGSFKIYLTNPSMRTALFSPLEEDDRALGALVETAIFAQWFHDNDAVQPIHYARWKKGEVDLVYVGAQHKVMWALEAKWSDRHLSHLDELSELLGFCRRHQLDDVIITTRTARRDVEIEGLTVEFRPAAEYCYIVGRNLIAGRARAQG